MTPDLARPSPQSTFAGGGGDMGARVRVFDWATTPLGAIGAWPPALRITVDQMLASKFPACLFWGADLVAIYNDGYRVLLGDKPDALGQPMRVTWAEAWPDLEPIARKALAGESTFIADYPMRIDRGTALEPAWFTFNYGPIFDEHGVVVGMLDTVVETTAQVLTLEHRTATLSDMQEALRQAQKMEAIGQLTGGIAHDFNNLLAAIGGSLEVVRMQVAAGRFADLSRYLDVSHRSVNRAAALTQRLLAFARRQTLDPRPIDMNAMLAGMLELVERSVGPSVRVVLKPAPGLWLTQADTSHLENALLNLCINARDAMPGGGTVTVETRNAVIDRRTAVHRKVPPGDYLGLCVTDTGTGMTPEIVERVFDPFFTTKPLGEGTGLGLSMVHGFVHQSGGHVEVRSEPGQGTTMCLYLPRLAGAAPMAPDAGAHPDWSGGRGETLLLVEDEADLREIVREVLEAAGYRVLDAGDAAQGLRVLQTAQTVDLLVTDVGLPGTMNGRQLADAGRALRPGLPVLFITGYAGATVTRSGTFLEPGMALLTKPFEIGSLVAKVREMLG